MKTLSVRLCNTLAVITCCALLATAAYLQLALGIEPCPLCIIQRIIFIALTFMFLLAAIYVRPTLGNRIYHFLIFLVAGGGGAVAGRQVWLQHLPSHQVPACGPSLNYMIDKLPLSQTLQLLIYGSGECSEVHWRFLSLSIAEWSLIFFICLGGLALVNVYRLKR